jgi:hypothetical protein
MRRKVVPRVEARVSRRHNAEVPEVPVFQPTVPASAATPFAEPDEPDDEAVRRMVEAAYT